MRKHVYSCLERVHGETLIDKKVGSLSGGELQRVMLALALEPLPNILILDEPLSGVDVEGMVSLMDMLDEIRKDYDLSIVMTTHDFGLLEHYADQVVLIDREILCQGSAKEVLSSKAFECAFHTKGGIV
jgi:zinc transport system ATP-binding protein